MAIPYEGPDPAGLLEAASIIRKKLPWVSDVFKTYLPFIKPHAHICCIPVGNGIELIHLRDYVGPAAKIYGVDIEKKVGYGGIGNLNQIAIAASGSIPIIGDIRQLNRIMHQMTKTPDIVISRHPQIIDLIEETTGKILKKNDWWLEPLATLVRRVKRVHGIFLATFYILPERDLLADALISKGFKPELFENDFSPQEEWIQAGPIIKKPDGFVLRV